MFNMSNHVPITNASIFIKRIVTMNLNYAIFNIHFIFTTNFKMYHYDLFFFFAS